MTEKFSVASCATLMALNASVAATEGTVVNLEIVDQTGKVFRAPIRFAELQNTVFAEDFCQIMAFFGLHAVHKCAVDVHCGGFVGYDYIHVLPADTGSTADIGSVRPPVVLL